MENILLSEFSRYLRCANVFCARNFFWILMSIHTLSIHLIHHINNLFHFINDTPVTHDVQSQHLISIIIFLSMHCMQENISPLIGIVIVILILLHTTTNSEHERAREKEDTRKRKRAKEKILEGERTREHALQ